MADVSRRLVAAPTDAARVPRARRRLRWNQVASYALLSLGAVVAITPFLWMVSWSLMTNTEIIRGQVIPASPVISNYQAAWETAQFSRFMWNSTRITAITVGGLLLFCIPAAYAFARMHFWGKEVLFAVMLSTLMIPDIVTLIPNFLTVVWINRFSESLLGEAGAWLNNWPSLTVPFMASAFTIFLLRQFFAQIPQDRVGRRAH
ncbi:MAG: carbohydrate ABC transporter permease [Anaerolineae bacterium]|nr:carbohydrate ABC transporter permease [Anaerolineae bacterium]